MNDRDNPPLTDAELDAVRDTPGLQATSGREMVPLPNGLRQRLVVEVKRLRLEALRLSYHHTKDGTASYCATCEEHDKALRDSPMKL